MAGIFQSSTPYDLTARRPLPGIAPLDMADWLLADEVFAQQMAERARLLAHRREEVLAATPGSAPAAAELLQTVLDWLGRHASAYDMSAEKVYRPDGVMVEIDRRDPLGTLGLLVQEDLCILEKRGSEHVLTAAVLCFPASWRLADKIGRPLIGIHRPVASYDAGVARRVQRLFDGVRPDRPLWRFNVLGYADADLYQPEPREEQEAAAMSGNHPYIRSERQCVLRLPNTRACVFSIHSYVLRKGAAVSDLTGQVAIEERSRSIV